MNGIIFFETIRRSWRQVFYWGVSIALYGALMYFMFDNNGLEGYGDLTETLGEEVTRAFGIGGEASLGTTEGFIGYAFFSYMLLILSVYMVMAGLNVTSVEEENGEMDLLLSLPIPRWRVVLEKCLAYSVLVIGIIGIGLIGLLVGDEYGRLTSNVTLSDYLEGALNMIPGSVLVLAFTAFVATLVKRRTTAAAIAGGFVVVSYITDIVTNVINTDASEAFSQLSIFTHYSGGSVLVNGMSWGGAIGMLIIAVILVGLAMQLFTRRDIAV